MKISKVEVLVRCRRDVEAQIEFFDKNRFGLIDLGVWLKNK